MWFRWECCTFPARHGTPIPVLQCSLGVCCRTAVPCNIPLCCPVASPPLQLVADPPDLKSSSLDFLFLLRPPSFQPSLRGLLRQSLSPQSNSSLLTYFLVSGLLASFLSLELISSACGISSAYPLHSSPEPLVNTSLRFDSCFHCPCFRSIQLATPYQGFQPIFHSF